MNATRTFKTLCLVLLAVVFLGTFPVMGQDDAKRGGFGQGRGRGQLFSLTERLVRQTRSMSDQLYLDYERDGGSDRRFDVDNLYRAQGLSSQAELFQKMVRDRRSERDLRRAVTLMTAQTGNGGQWTEIRQTLNEISQNLANYNNGGGNGGGYNGGGNGGGYNGGGYQSGNVRWSGRVDADVYVYIQDNFARTQVMAGAPTYGEQFTFSTPLPRRDLTVSVERLRGRGRVEVIQQPSRNNNYTAIVRIQDRDSGSGDYEFQLNW